MAVLELVGQKWMLRILWELRDAPLTFRALRARCDNVSPTVLNQRLAALREAGLVELGDDGYEPTELCRGLGDILLQLTDWSRRWEKERPAPADED
ncbi:helix-turn-helix domain-containing protein [Maricaulis sp.]|uniref:winged helix-turn-helix transcriptional regulator n=1 Tax=Maricaulis sp. TaxID=1486257 RepID=UPI003298A6EC